MQLSDQKFLSDLEFPEKYKLYSKNDLNLDLNTFESRNYLEKTWVGGVHMIVG